MLGCASLHAAEPDYEAELQRAVRMYPPGDYDSVPVRRFEGVSGERLLPGSGTTLSQARDITTAELASFLGISSWETRVDLPPNSYSVDICPIEDGQIGGSLIQGQIDWSKDPDGQFTFVAGPEERKYRISISSRTGGTLSVSTQVPLFLGTYSPALPAQVSEGVFILFADTVKRDEKGSPDQPSTYRRGFVVKVTKKN